MFIKTSSWLRISQMQGTLNAGEAQSLTLSVNISGLEAAANVAAQGEMANALGEGFADGLDVAGF